MQRKAALSLEHDDIIAALEAAKREASANRCKVSIAMVDEGGHLLGFLRMAEATPLSAQVAVGKARTAALARRDSKYYEDMIRGGRDAYLSVPNLVFLEGGVTATLAGACVGAVGVSGALPAQDAHIATAAINELMNRQSTV